MARSPVFTRRVHHANAGSEGFLPEWQVVFCSAWMFSLPYWQAGGVHSRSATTNLNVHFSWSPLALFNTQPLSQFPQSRKANISPKLTVKFIQQLLICHIRRIFFHKRNFFLSIYLIHFSPILANIAISGHISRLSRCLNVS